MESEFELRIESQSQTSKCTPARCTAGLPQTKDFYRDEKDAQHIYRQQKPRACRIVSATWHRSQFCVGDHDHQIRLERKETSRFYKGVMDYPISKLA